MNNLHEVWEELRHLGEQFSLESGHRTHDIQCTVEDGKTVAIDVTPPYFFVKVAFYRPSGLLVRCKGQGATFDEAARATVNAVIGTPGHAPKPAEVAP